MFVPIQAIPYVRLAKRLFSGQGSLQSIAYRQDTLCPEEKTTLRPAVFLPGQLDRIIRFKPTDAVAVTTKEGEIAEAIATTVVHAPTIAYHIKDAILFDGSFYVGRFKHPIADLSLFNSDRQKPIHIKSCALASSYLGTKFFYHWLADDCTRYLLAEEVGTPLRLRMPAYGHLQNYQTYFNEDWTPTDRAYIDHLVVFQDFSQNSLKRERYKILRDRVKAHFFANDRDTARDTKVYLKRGRTGAARTIQNEDEIISALTKLGFMVVDIKSDTLEHMIATLLKAKIVVSLEGSHIAHCTFTSPEHSGLLVLQPPDRFSAIHRSWAECLGVRFGFVVGSVSEAGYCFSVPEILRTIDLLLGELEA